MKQGVLIFVMAILAAIVYGILHDLITTRICLEYFTVAHPPVWHGTQDPTLLAFTWGVIATWWVGAFLGLPLALAARAGKQPKRSARSLIGPIAILLLCMAICAALAGVSAYVYYRPRAAMGALFDPLVSGIPVEKQLAFLVDAWAHLASYASGFLGGLVLIGYLLISRYHAHVREQLADRRTG